MSYTGGCQCGSIKYTFTGEPVYTVLCYCNDCMRSSGSVGTSSLLIPKDTLSTNGTVKVYSRKTFAGAEVNTHFCGECGTPCWATGTKVDSGGLVNVRAGTLDDLSLNEKWKPTLEIYCKDKYKWLPAIDGATSFEEMTPTGKRT